MSHDEEKELGAGQPKVEALSSSDDNSSLDPASYGSGFLGKLLYWEAQLDRKLGVESQAIVRMRAEDKTPQPWHQQATMALLWAGATMNVSCFSTGFLGWEFGLDLGQSITITIFGTLLGSMVAGVRTFLFFNLCFLS